MESECEMETFRVISSDDDDDDGGGGGGDGDDERARFKTFQQVAGSLSDISRAARNSRSAIKVVGECFARPASQSTISVAVAPEQGVALMASEQENAQFRPRLTSAARHNDARVPDSTNVRELQQDIPCSRTNYTIDQDQRYLS